MKSRFIPLLLGCACVSVAHADYNPVALTPSSYQYDIVVEASTVQPSPDCINATAGNGITMGDNTYYEQGLRDRPGNVGWNSGIPVHGTVFTNINDSNIKFKMPPSYLTENTLMIDTTFPDKTLTLATPTAATSLAILGTSGGGSMSVSYTVNHEDGGTESGTISFADWFNNSAAQVAWGANGRITAGGGYNNYNSSAVNNNPPYLHCYKIAVTNASKVTNIRFYNPSAANHVNVLGLSTSTDSVTYTPVDVTGFNVKAIVPAAIPFPVTATLDQGTNLVSNGNLATWFEDGFYRKAVGNGLPQGGYITSFSQSTHHYQLAPYDQPNAILIDTNHQTANVTPLTPASYSSFALLTAGGNVGWDTPMTNICVLQHDNGVNETNFFMGYDWFSSKAPGAVAYEVNGRVNMNSRTVNNVGNKVPYLFETYFLVNDPSPVTNIFVKYFWAANANSTTYIMAVSAASGGIAPVVNSGPIPLTPSVWPSEGVTFTAGAVGTPPLTGYWEVKVGPEDYEWAPLVDGVSPYGTIISGSKTTSLSLTNVHELDGTNYHYVAVNAFGSSASPAATLTVKPQTISIASSDPAVSYKDNAFSLRARRSDGPAVTLQWFYVDTNGQQFDIPGATNDTYSFVTPLSLDQYRYGVTAKNAYGTNTASVTLSVTESPAFLPAGADLLPGYAEAYIGTPVTYMINAKGSSPLSYRWFVNGSEVSTNRTTNAITVLAACGATTVQVAFTNALSDNNWVTSSIVTLKGIGRTNVTFNTNGLNWQTNTIGAGAVPTFTNNVLRLTDGGGSEASSAYFKTAQYVGGKWNASFSYNSHGGAADGAAFVIQNSLTNVFARGDTGGALGYLGNNGALSNSIALQFNLWGDNPGIAFNFDGATGGYKSTAPVSLKATNAISVKLNYANGVLAVSLTDTLTKTNFSTNYVVGSLVDYLKADVAYIGFSGGTGGSTAIQDISDFSFQSVYPDVKLTVSSVTPGTVVLSWPAADPNFKLETTSSLTTPVTWSAGPAATVVGGVNYVTVSTADGSTQRYYRLSPVACP